MGASAIRQLLGFGVQLLELGFKSFLEVLHLFLQRDDLGLPFILLDLSLPK